nr:eukaryotic translation initiation factor 3 subunit M-like [Tanacetum cinerariifolium]
MELCTKLSDRILEPEKIKTAQAKEIANLKKKVKKLERKTRSRTPWMILFKIGTSRRRSLGEDDAFKHERNLKQRSIFEESDFDVQAMMDADYETEHSVNELSHTLSATNAVTATMTTVVPTSEEDPALAVVRFTAEMSWAEAGPEVGEAQVSSLCMEAQECMIGGRWFDLASLMLTSANLVFPKANDKGI